MAAAPEKNPANAYKPVATRDDVLHCFTECPAFAVGYWLRQTGHALDPDFWRGFAAFRALAGPDLEYVVRRYEEGRAIHAEAEARLGRAPPWTIGNPRPPLALVDCICQARGIAT